jgi:hypothetical protein
MDFAKVMQLHASYCAPSPSPLLPSGGEDKGEGGQYDIDLRSIIYAKVYNGLLSEKPDWFALV